MKQEPIWEKAEQMGVRILTDPSWTLEDGAAYGEFERRGPWILMPVSLPMRIERFLISHELGHHVAPGLIDNPRWLSERRADRWAVKTLLELGYDVDQVEWPARVLDILQELAPMYPERFQEWRVAA